MPGDISFDQPCYPGGRIPLRCGDIIVGRYFLRLATIRAATRGHGACSHSGISPPATVAQRQKIGRAAT